MSRHADRLAEHFEQLCGEVGVEWDYHDEGIWHSSYAAGLETYRVNADGSCHKKFTTWYVYVPRIEDTVSYFVALHELGHSTQPQRMPTLQREYDAWAGAGEVACTKANIETWKRIAWSMLSYASDRRLKPYQPFYDLLALAVERSKV